MLAVPSQNIARDEARIRAAALAVQSYKISLDLTGAEDGLEGSGTFLSRVLVRFECRAPGTGSWVDLIAEEVLSAELNGRALDPTHYDGARLALPDLEEDNLLEVHARCRYMTTGEGLHRLVDPADGATYVYTQMATAEARRVFACFEQPDLKGTFTWRIVAPQEWVVRSNTRAARCEPAGAGLSAWDFPATQPLPTYLAALCAGPFHVVESHHAGVGGTYPLALLVRSSAAEHLDAEEILGITRAGLAHYEREFDHPYPFGAYDQVALPEFNFGAMENAGLVIFNEDLFLFRSRVTEAARELRAMVICHEMAHMWFGNLVTMRWWDDLWLNESFAEWSGYRVAAEATRHTHAWTSFALARKAWAYMADQQPSTHPVVADIADLDAVYLNFDGITYAKGAAVVKQLVAFVGRDAFLAGLNQYFAKHAWGNAELGDLLSALAHASGRDLSDWSAVWLEKPGVTILSPVVSVDADDRYTEVRIDQAPPVRPAGLVTPLRPHRVAVGVYRWTGESPPRLVRECQVEVEVPAASAQVPELVGLPRADLLLVNDDDLTYAKLRMDEGSLRTALAGVGALGDSLARTLVWGALWQLVRDGLLPAQEHSAAAVAGLAAESRATIIETVLAQARQGVQRYVAVERRGAAADGLCCGSAALLDGAEPGSDRQLALGMGHVAAAYCARHLDRLSAMLEGRAELDGLAVDDDLRWAIITRLAGVGRLSGDHIGAAEAADRTSKGERLAARARAAVPTAAAKSSAWAAATSGRLSNAVLAGTVAGFSDDAAPPEILAPFRQAYVDGIVDLWSALSPAQAQVLARGLFPGIDPATVQAADVLLSRDDLPVGLRRVVSEGRAEVVLALDAQEASRAGG
jgi:aminopeptidase N